MTLLSVSQANEPMECNDMASKYDFGSFCTGFGHSCNDIASKYGVVQGYAAHVRRILAAEALRPYLEPISQHETGKTAQDATIWPLSTTCNNGTEMRG